MPCTSSIRSDALCLLGAFCSLGPDRRVAAGLSRAHEPAVAVLGVAQPARLCRVHHPSDRMLYAFWEPFVAWGLIAAWLLVFRERMNQPSQFWAWLNRRAYAVYIIHPVVLVGISLLLRGWAAPALAQFARVG